jgi:hypothetical protein
MLSSILFVLAGAFLIYQLIIGAAFAAMLRTGQYTKVNISIIPLIVATLLVIVAILV